MATTWKRALVTGASSGIGEAFARRLAILGADLVLVARDQVRLEKLADELDDFHGVHVEVLAADLADPVQRGVVEARLAATTEPVHLLVNNAGFGHQGRVGVLPVEREDDEIQVNVVAVMRLCHAVAARWRAEAEADRGQTASRRRRPPRGGIVNVASTAAFQPVPTMANYAATKAYVASFSQALHEELRSAGVTVTCLAPGYTHTEFQERSGHDPHLPGLLWQKPEEVAAAGLAGVSTGRALVVSGALNKTLQVSSRLAPEALTRRLAGRYVGRT